MKGIQIAIGNFDASKCPRCIIGKSHRAPFPKISETKSSKPLELVHSDVVSPLQTPSIGGSRYFITLKDEYSKRTVMLTMRNKSETFECFKKYINYAENHIRRKLNKLKIHSYCSVSSLSGDTSDVFQLETLRSDNGRE